jgi:hypothetical protein
MNIPIKRLKAIYEASGEKYKPIKAFLEDEPEYIEKAEGFITLLRESDKMGHDVQVTMSAIIRANKFLKDIDYSDSSGDTAGKQLAVPPSIFTHSDDFTHVCVRGRDFDLTLQQAKIVQFMYEQHQRGTRNLHKTRILNHIGVPSHQRLRDLFLSRKGTWGTLIVKGTGRGFFRLNIFD